MNMNDIIEEISKRKSIRNYIEKEISEDVYLRLIEAGRLAPTAKNRQKWKIIIVNDKDLKEKLVPACNDQVFVSQASAIFVAISTEDYIMRCNIPADIVDTSIVLQNIVIQAVKEGLGTCYIGSFYPDQVKKVLGIPEDIKIIQLLTVGYPKEYPLPKPRKPLEEFYSFNAYE